MVSSQQQPLISLLLSFCSVIQRKSRRQSPHHAITVVTTKLHSGRPATEEPKRQETGEGRIDNAGKHRHKRQLTPVCIIVFYMCSVAFCQSTSVF